MLTSSNLLLTVLTGSIFAYGQTSSGKTYTMSAITEFAVADIFDYIFQVHPSSQYNINPPFFLFVLLHPILIKSGCCL